MDPYQKVAASVFHEIYSQAIKDTSLLLFHQIAAKAYHDGLVERDADISEFESIYSKQEEIELRRQLIDIVMKFHILDPQGIASRITPLIHNIMYPNDLIQINDPLVAKIVSNSNQFTNVENPLEQIMHFDFNELNEQSLFESYGDPSDQIEVAIYEDDTIQCACEYCEKFFAIVEKQENLNASELNPIQQILAKNYGIV